MLLFHDGQCFFVSVCTTIASIAGQSVVSICNSNNSRFQWDLVAFEFVWIATSVKILMMMQDNGCDQRIQAKRFNEISSQLSRMLDHEIFGFRKTTGFVHDEFVDGNLAYIMDLGGKSQSLYLSGCQIHFLPKGRGKLHHLVGVFLAMRIAQTNNTCK